MSSIDHIRNFAIIAHIDHGKSTIADRIIQRCGGLSDREMKDQVLDSMDIERERGITIKSHPIQMEYNYNDTKYIFNLIDTPGHVDFTYEVSRSMAACEGALLLIDSTQGIEAQTVSNVYLAMDANLEIIPILNKIDMKNANIEETQVQVSELLGITDKEIFSISAKSGKGVSDLFDIIIDKIPHPDGNNDTDILKALIFDSYFDQYRGVVVYVKVVSGKITKDMNVSFFKFSGNCEILEVGILKLNKVASDELNQGDVGYVILSIKDVSKIKVGDTITDSNNPADKPLEGYKPIKPMVFSGLYPVDSKDFDDLRVSLDKLKLNDSSLSYEPNTSVALGFGFRCGFLGPLHMEIIQERLEREFDLNLISTCPNVVYVVELKDEKKIKISNPSDMPDSVEINAIYEPYIKIEIVLPKEYIGPIMNLCTSHRAEYVSTSYLSTKKVQMNFEMPLAEIIFDFFEKLKALTKGYASLDYEVIDERVSKLIKLDIKVAGEIVDALSIIIHNDNSYKKGSQLCKRLKEEIHRQQFEIPIQAVIGNKVIARETIKALRKNVTAKCYGGDISRKRKLLEKQKKGKKRMKQIGNVELPQKAFLAILKSDNDS